MLNIRDELSIHIHCAPIDMRKAVNGLSALVVDEFESSPQSGNLYLFYNKTRNRIKILFWDGNGFVIYYKRLEGNKFMLPREMDLPNFTISPEQLSWLLAGLDFQLMNKFPHLNYSNYY